MSTNGYGLEITRSIVINTPQEFYRLLTDIQYRTPQFIPFMDRVDIYTNGCTCQAENNFKQVVEEYRKFINFDMTELKEKARCATIQFYLDGELLFSL